VLRDRHHRLDVDLGERCRSKNPAKTGEAVESRERSNMKLIFAFLSTLGALATLAAQETSSPSAVQIKTADLWQVVTVDKVSLEGTLKTGTKFEVNIESDKPKPEQNYLGAAAGAAVSAVSEITVKMGGEKISFPKAAFVDLANAKLQTVSLTSQPSGEVRLRFTGGDAPTTYEAAYFIVANRLAKRSISYFEPTAGGTKHEVIKTTTF
jgi:hypothetical protein